LAQIKQGRTVTAAFGYDGFGRRESKSIGASTTDFLYDGLNPVQEQSSGGSVTANLLTGLNIDEFFARTASGTTSAFLADALGSTIGLVTANGGPIATSYTYEPFGNTAGGGASNTNPYQFTGRENDGTGLYYYRARYYSPTFQRFVSQDPIDFAGGDANLYAYGRSDPSDLLDPFGLKWTDWQTVKATVEATTAQGNNLSTSYGYDTDTGVFVALPDEVLNGQSVEIRANGQDLIVPVGDVGPWNGGHTNTGKSLNDPYWDTNRPPEAACNNRDYRNRPTNGAGIDLSPMLAKLLGINGSGAVKWRGK
jgi:RHS repeat-associated protein